MSEEHRILRTLILWMVWLKAYVIVLVGLVCFCVCTCVCIAVASGSRNVLQQQRQHLERLPVVNTFLSSHKRSFDPSKDEGEQCMICLEEFQVDDGKQIA